MFCTHCGKEIREGSKFCTNCGAAVKSNAVKMEPKAAVAEAAVNAADPIETQENKTENVSSNLPEQDNEGAVKNEEISGQTLPVMPKEGNKLHAGLIVLIIVILCCGGWFLGGRDLIFDTVGISDSKKTTKDISSLHKNDIEETEDDNEDIKEVETSESSMETVEEEVIESNDTEEEEAANSDEFIEEEEEIEEPSEYIIENSDTRYLTKDDLMGMTAEECRLARNELYARHGRKFDDEQLRSHFEACSWYHGFIDAGDFQESMLSDIEIANRDLIVEFEKEMGYR